MFCLIGLLSLLLAVKAFEEECPSAELQIISLREDLPPIITDPPRKETLNVLNDATRHVPTGAQYLWHMNNGDLNDPSWTGSVYDALLQAYNNHADVTLVPDDIWVTVMLVFSRYVNEHAEAMRDRFVEFAGKRGLWVDKWTGDDEGWPEFIEEMIQRIQANTKQGVIPILEANFTTTTSISRTVSNIVIMDAFKRYFDYEGGVPWCGIRRVRFAGTLGDWHELPFKLQKLGNLTGPGWFMDTYVPGLLPVLGKFVETYEGKVDNEFWDKVLDITHERSGCVSYTYVSGWVLALYGKSGTVNPDSLETQYMAEVPVKWKNKQTGAERDLGVRSGFTGLIKEDGSYRPQLSVIVFDQTRRKHIEAAWERRKVEAAAEGKWLIGEPDWEGDDEISMVENR
jgi:hypothetical protein